MIITRFICKDCVQVSFLFIFIARMEVHISTRDNVQYFCFCLLYINRYIYHESSQAFNTVAIMAKLQRAWYKLIYTQVEYIRPVIYAV